MRTLPIPRRRHSGFTLIELLMVILIIGVLASLLLAAVFKVLGKTDEVRNRNDISQLNSAVVFFQSKFQVDHIPSLIILCETLDDYYNNSYPGENLNPRSNLHRDSVAYLTRLWPRLIGTGFDMNMPPRPIRFWNATTPFARGIDWNGNNAIDSGAMLLEGDQCLVFFLGGIPDNISGTAGCLGFSTNPTSPATPGGDRIGPLFEFATTRLSILPLPMGYPMFLNATRSTLHYSYQDTYGSNVFAYFSGYRTANQYNRYFSQTAGVNFRPFSDCLYLGFVNSASVPAFANGIWPHAEVLAPAPRFLNPKSFQIVSAGRNGIFGVGTNLTSASPQVWQAALATDVYPEVKPTDTGVPFERRFGYDDQANFYERNLGVPAP